MCAVTVFAEAAGGGGGDFAFFTGAIDTLKTVVVLIGGGVAVWGVINLLEGYGNDNPGAKSQGMKQLMAGVGIALIGLTLVPQLSTMFTGAGA
ncbi:MAG: Maff2 family protein [Oscillospiraceae bacterium]|nr:Maff2 family protein [Oscillospiraceae bacterium]